MHKTLIASVLTIAVAFNGLSATPAQAGNDLAKVIAGVATLYIIGKAVQNSRQDNAQPARANQRPYFLDKGHRKCLRQKYRDGRWVTYRDRKCMQRHKERRVEKPRACLRKRWTNDGWKKYYDRSCLRRYNAEAGYRDDYRSERDHDRRREHD